MRPARKRIVGVLGGMGPEATVLLMSRVIALTPADDDADHAPLLVDQNPQVPSRIRALIEGTGESAGPTLAMMARRLARAGAEALAMPCNTAHGYADAIREAADVPFLDMVALAADRLAATAPGGPVGMLGSPAVRKLGLYERALSERGIETRWPEDEPALLDAIRRLKRDGRDADAAETLRRLARGLRIEGADHLLIACTEFSLAAEAVAAEGPALDALDALAAEIVAFSLGRRAAPSSGEAA